MFQSTVCFCDAPPVFGQDEMTRSYELLQNVHVCRIGVERVASPHKRAVMNLSGSFERRRLGKQQQVLCEITHRCREQEVTDLSKNLVSKCAIAASNGPVRREAMMYNTASMQSITRHTQVTLSQTMDNLENMFKGTLSKPVYDRGYTFFRVRKIIKDTKNTDLSASSTSSLPQVSKSSLNGHPSTKFHGGFPLSYPARYQGVHHHHTNGPMTLEQYLQPKLGPNQTCFPSINEHIPDVGEVHPAMTVSHPAVPTHVSKTTTKNKPAIKKNSNKKTPKRNDKQGRQPFEVKQPQSDTSNLAPVTNRKRVEETTVLEGENKEKDISKERSTSPEAVPVSSAEKDERQEQVDYNQEDGLSEDTTEAPTDVTDKTDDNHLTAGG